MSLEQKPIDPRLFELVAHTVKEGLECVQQLEAENKYIGTHLSWPQLSYWDSGLPNIHENLLSGPTDYKGAFGLYSDHHVRIDELQTFEALLNYAYSDNRIKGYFIPPNRTEPDEKLFKVEVFFLAGYLIDRYMHVYKDASFSVERLLPMYVSLESGLLKELLLVDIVVPILFLKFDFDSIALGNDATIERMNDGFQLARASKRAYGPGVHTSVLSSATHAFILGGWELRNRSWWEVTNVYSETSAYPLRSIDRFFAAIRIATGTDTGYAQLLMRPVEWAHDYTAHLPPIEGTSIRGYPTWFENFYWLNPVPTLTAEDTAEVERVYSRLTEVESNKLRIATQRLNRCFLRESEEDSILDATIAMELLLADDSRQEITHKLALRMAALSKLAPENKQTPVEVYRAIKRIYAYRSAIVHGSTKASGKREITLGSKGKISAVTAAVDYLRMALGVLTEHEEYLDPAEIDEKLLLK